SASRTVFIVASPVEFRTPKRRASWLDAATASFQPRYVRSVKAGSVARHFTRGTVASSRLTFRLLGPLEVLDGDTPLWLGGPRQRALLALLLLDANKVVSRDRLIDELFSGQDSRSADGTLRVQMSRLRAVLGISDGELIVRQ